MAVSQSVLQTGQNSEVTSDYIQRFDVRPALGTAPLPYFLMFRPIMFCSNLFVHQTSGYKKVNKQRRKVG